MTGLDWGALLHTGLHDLRLMPAQFWALTPAELAVMTGHTGQGGPMGRTGLDALMAAYPDTGAVNMKDVADG